jgi:hypothetical protein
MIQIISRKKKWNKGRLVPVDIFNLMRAVVIGEDPETYTVLNKCTGFIDKYSKEMYIVKVVY